METRQASSIMAKMSSIVKVWPDGVCSSVAWNGTRYSFRAENRQLEIIRTTDHGKTVTFMFSVII